MGDIMRERQEQGFSDEDVRRILEEIKEDYRREKMEALKSGARKVTDKLPKIEPSYKRMSLDELIAWADQKGEKK